jgi:riboflavin kinase/FMN adenylyltransferase
MQIIRLTYPLESPEAVRFPSQVTAIGDFDGIHLGHQEVIRRAIARAKERGVPASIMTFHPHPREVLGQNQYTQVLTPFADKMELFAALGIHHVYVVEFDDAFSRVDARQFVERIVHPLGIDTVVVGFDFRFGHRAQGTPDTLCELGRGAIAVEVVRPFHSGGRKVSSTLVREYLREGRIGLANELLGRPYRLRGTVVSGMARGRTIGFPTANIELTEPYVVPRNGVYSIRLHLDGRAHEGIMNIGVRPTFEGGETKPSLEAHIFDFNRTIYGESVAVEFMAFLRPERKFASVSELIEQIRRDIAQCVARRYGE